MAPTTVPSTPPAAAPITVLFTLRPVAAPRIAPAATPMIVLCAPIEPRRCVRDGAGDGSGAEVGDGVAATTSPFVVTGVGSVMRSGDLGAGR